MLDKAVYVRERTSACPMTKNGTLIPVTRWDMVELPRPLNRGRWMHVEVLEEGQVVAIGWIDADFFVRNVERVDLE